MLLDVSVRFGLSHYSALEAMAGATDFIGSSYAGTSGLVVYTLMYCTYLLSPIINDGSVPGVFPNTEGTLSDCYMQLTSIVLPYLDIEHNSI